MQKLQALDSFPGFNFTTVSHSPVYIVLIHTSKRGREMKTFTRELSSIYTIVKTMKGEYGTHMDLDSFEYESQPR